MSAEKIWYSTPGEKSHWPESDQLGDVPHDVLSNHKDSTRIVTFRPPKIPSQYSRCDGCTIRDCEIANTCWRYESTFLNLLDWLYSVATNK